MFSLVVQTSVSHTETPEGPTLPLHPTFLAVRTPESRVTPGASELQPHTRAVQMEFLAPGIGSSSAAAVTGIQGLTT